MYSGKKAQHDFPKMRGGGSKAVWNFSKNSSVLETPPFPKHPHRHPHHHPPFAGTAICEELRRRLLHVAGLPHQGWYRRRHCHSRHLCRPIRSTCRRTESCLAAKELPALRRSKNSQKSRWGRICSGSWSGFAGWDQYHQNDYDGYGGTAILMTIPMSNMNGWSKTHEMRIMNLAFAAWGVGWSTPRGGTAATRQTPWLPTSRPWTTWRTGCEKCLRRQHGTACYGWYCFQRHGLMEEMWEEEQ